MPYYTVNSYDKEVPIVISEHGGYLLRDDGNVISDALANQLIGPGSGFNHEMKKRSIGSRVMNRSVISNTMTFMNNPHIMRKATPFILLESAAWNTRYYASLLVPQDFQRGNPWEESQLINFYKLFAEVKGKRVLSSCEDPDIQYQTFLDGKDLFVVLNNLSKKEETINFELTNTDFESIHIKRHGQNSDFTPYFTEENPDSIDRCVNT